MIKNPTNEQRQRSLCHLCHWKDADEMLCHAYGDPPIVIDFAINNSSECWYDPWSHWNRMPQEYKDRVLEEWEEQSRRRQERLKGNQ